MNIKLDENERERRCFSERGWRGGERGRGCRGRVRWVGEAWPKSEAGASVLFIERIMISPQDGVVALEKAHAGFAASFSGLQKVSLDAT